MKELHRQLNTEECTNLAPSEVEGSICLCSNSTFPTSTSLGGNHKLNDKEISGVLKLAKKIEEIHKRLVSEGYIIQNGKIYKL